MGKSWDLSHDPSARPLGCNGRWGPSGRNAHRRRGEEPCRRCKRSSAHYAREWRRKGIKPKQLQPCGTWGAAQRHWKNGEELDLACKLASATRAVELRDKERATMDRVPSKGPRSPYSAGGRTILARTCTKCGKFADGDSFPIINAGKKNQARRSTCHDCTNAQKKADREERGIGVPAPRPPEELQTSKYTLWTAEDDQRMRELVAAGDSYENIALVLGRSLRSVYKRRSDLGLTKVRISHRVAEPWKIQ